MGQPLCKLTLVYPPTSEDQVIEVLLSIKPPIQGFTSWIADGHGLSFSEASANERVRGRVKRGVLVVIMPRDRADALLDVIRTDIAVPRLAYWIEPVETFGRLVTEPAALMDQAICKSI